MDMLRYTFVLPIAVIAFASFGTLGDSTRRILLGATTSSATTSSASDGLLPALTSRSEAIATRTLSAVGRSLTTVTRQTDLRRLTAIADELERIATKDNLAARLDLHIEKLQKQRAEDLDNVYQRAMQVALDHADEQDIDALLTRLETGADRLEFAEDVVAKNPDAGFGARELMVKLYDIQRLPDGEAAKWLKDGIEVPATRGRSVSYSEPVTGPLVAGGGDVTLATRTERSVFVPEFFYDYHYGDAELASRLSFYMAQRRTLDDVKALDQMDPPTWNSLFDINNASVEELARIPMVGPKRARAIAEARPLSTMEDLMSIDGISEVLARRITKFLDGVGDIDRVFGYDEFAYQASRISQASKRIYHSRVGTGGATYLDDPHYGLVPRLIRASDYDEALGINAVDLLEEVSEINKRHLNTRGVVRGSDAYGARLQTRHLEAREQLSRAREVDQISLQSGKASSPDFPEASREVNARRDWYHTVRFELERLAQRAFSPPTEMITGAPAYAQLVDSMSKRFMRQVPIEE